MITRTALVILNISCYIEPILLESDEDTPIYREVMRITHGNDVYTKLIKKPDCAK